MRESLLIYVKHQAYLNTTPSGEEQPRKTKYPLGSPYLDRTLLSPYAESLLILWQEAGTVAQGGQINSGLTWLEITSWANRFYSEECIEWVLSPNNRYVPINKTKCILMDYELILIKDISQTYAYELSCTSPTRECPIVLKVEDNEEVLIKNADNMEAALIAMFGLTPSSETTQL